MLQFIDSIIDTITMYKLVLYELIGLLLVALIFGFLNILPYTPGSILFSTGFILFISLITNGIFATIFEASTNVESVYISALILALILTPFRSLSDIPLLFWAPVLAMASKYILAINRSHIFNPVAIAVVLTALWIGAPASWWLGNAAMTPFIVVFGLIIVRKIRRGDMILTFFLIAGYTELFFTFLHGGDMVSILKTLILHSSLLFFAFVMLTEPLTTPPTKNLQIFYGGMVGFLFSPYVHLGSLYSTPELALVVGNIFSYLVSPRQKLFLHIKEKVRYGEDVIDFIFSPSSGRMTFSPGQYMEWTLPHDDPDIRGNRRYLTIASSPTEEDIHLGIKFYPQGSSFKKALAALDEKNIIVAGNLAGDFILPDDPKTKLVFIAGGIGITPFRSMIKYCLDKNQQRDIVLLYSNRIASEVAFTDVFQQAHKVGIKTVYTVTDEKSISNDWHGRRGRITPDVIKEEIPDFKDRTFYLSGPHPMVMSYVTMLTNMGISRSHIKQDFFPGYS